MRFFAFSLLLLLAFSFPYIGMDCTEFNRMCGESACTHAGGHYSEGVCVQGENFTMEYYQNATGECARLTAQCEETGGMYIPPRNASCCGPVFVFLAALGFAVRSVTKR